MTATASRRAFLTTGALMVATTTVAPAVGLAARGHAAGLDAALIADCRELARVNLIYEEQVSTEEDSLELDARLDALATTVGELENRIAETPSRTRMGLLAKAAAAKNAMPLDNTRTKLWPHADNVDRLAWSLCEDLLLMSPDVLAIGSGQAAGGVL